jgi:hypothetical protein
MDPESAADDKFFIMLQNAAKSGINEFGIESLVEPSLILQTRRFDRRTPSQTSCNKKHVCID